MKYKLAEGVKAQSLAVNVQETRPGLSYAVTVRKDVMVRPGEVVETAYDLGQWVQAGLLVEVYDAAAQFKAAVVAVVPLATPALAPDPEPVSVPESEPAPEPEPAPAPDLESTPVVEAAPEDVAKAARAARRRS